MTSIKSIGTGSGVLTSDVIDKLIAAEGDPITKKLDAQKTANTDKATEFNKLKGLLTTLQSSASALALPSAFRSNTSSSSNEAAISATAGSTAVPGNYSVKVTSLAQNQTIASKEYASMDSVVGEGTLQFVFGNTSFDSNTSTFSFTANTNKANGTVQIDASNHTLAGVRDAINNAGMGVTASIVDTGTGYKLLLQSADSGASSGFKLVANNPSNGLADLEYKDATTQMTQTLQGQDAQLTVNGLAVTRSSNMLAGVISGVTLNLKQVTSSPVTVSVARDTTAITKKVQSFVDAYNELKNEVNAVTAFNSDTGTGAFLIGDTTVRAIVSQLQQTIGSVVPGLVGTSFRTLAEVGITTNYKTGTLEFNSSLLTERLNSSSDNVTGLFGTLVKASDSQVKVLSAGNNTKPGSYALNITQLATRSVLTGAATAGGSFDIDSNNDNFTLQVDGVQSGSISLTQKTGYTGAELAVEMQTRINSDSALKAGGASVEVSYDSGTGAFSITSGRYGSRSKVLMYAVDTNTASTLGLSPAGASPGVDVAGTINGVAATGVGQLLTAPNGNDSAGMMVEVRGGATGSRGTVSYIRGIADQLDSVISRLTDKTLSARLDGLQTEATKIEQQRTKLQARLDAERARLETQFTYNDTLISKLNSTGTYMTSQLKMLETMITGKSSG